ncbi:hypothetical protein DWY99_01100 [[Clostridium] leptum]|uniref:Uncharacterized protein n=1 Tax=[Clostridium] leptum TaxID=1535 RepID=A0A412B0V2_9FIRM|nr:hypothetical protein DWY99_01100 [[Clostridium] leptum]
MKKVLLSAAGIPREPRPIAGKSDGIVGFTAQHCGTAFSDGSVLCYLKQAPCIPRNSAPGLRGGFSNRAADSYRSKGEAGKQLRKRGAGSAGFCFQLHHKRRQGMKP